MAQPMTRLRSHSRALAWVFVLNFVSLLAAHHACAQTAQETALARSLFEEGVTLADRADWPGAADRFGRAYALKPTSGIAFNYASVLIELGRFVEASELLRVVTRDAAANEELRRQSEEKLQQVQPRIAYLAVHVEGEPRSQARVDVDDAEWPRMAWGVASPVDPGPHKVRAVVDGVEHAQESIELSEGERRELTLKLGTTSVVSLPQVEDPDPLDNTPPPLDQEARDGRKPLYKSWLLWTGVGLAVAGGVVAAVLLTSDRTSEGKVVEGNVSPTSIEW
jgi:hypothetical protein